MNLDKKTSIITIILGVFSILCLIIGPILLAAGTDLFNQSKEYVSSTIDDFFESNNIRIFGVIFILAFFIIDIAVTTKILIHSWKNEWCAKNKLTFSLVGLFFGGLFFIIYSGIGISKIKQEESSNGY